MSERPWSPSPGRLSEPRMRIVCGFRGVDVCSRFVEAVRGRRMPLARSVSETRPLTAVAVAIETTISTAPARKRSHSAGASGALADVRLATGRRRTRRAGAGAAGGGACSVAARSARRRGGARPRSPAAASAARRRGVSAAVASRCWAAARARTACQGGLLRRLAGRPRRACRSRCVSPGSGVGVVLGSVGLRLGASAHSCSPAGRSAPARPEARLGARRGVRSACSAIAS